MFSLSIRTMQFEPAKTWLLLGSPEGVGPLSIPSIIKPVQVQVQGKPPKPSKPNKSDIENNTEPG